MSSAYNVWNYGRPAEMRAYAIEQDTRFQQAMRKELAAMAADRGLRLVPNPPRKPRDIINIMSSAPSGPAALRDASDGRQIIIVVMPQSGTPIPPKPEMAWEPKWKDILKEVSKKRGVRVIDILSARRRRDIVHARYEAMYRMRHETTLSYPQIGDKLGGKDHATAMHGVRRYTEMLEAGEA